MKPTQTWWAAECVSLKQHVCPTGVDRSWSTSIVLQGCRRGKKGRFVQRQIVLHSSRNHVKASEWLSFNRHLHTVELTQQKKEEHQRTDSTQKLNLFVLSSHSYFFVPSRDSWTNMTADVSGGWKYCIASLILSPPVLHTFLYILGDSYSMNLLAEFSKGGTKWNDFSSGFMKWDFVTDQICGILSCTEINVSPSRETGHANRFYLKVLLSFITAAALCSLKLTFLCAAMSSSSVTVTAEEKGLQCLQYIPWTVSFYSCFSILASFKRRGKVTFGSDPMPSGDEWQRN